MSAAEDDAEDADDAEKTAASSSSPKLQVDSSSPSFNQKKTNTTRLVHSERQPNNY